jgi:hypothetical protein
MTHQLSVAPLTRLAANLQNVLVVGNREEEWRVARTHGSNMSQILDIDKSGIAGFDLSFRVRKYFFLFLSAL